MAVYCYQNNIVVKYTINGYEAQNISDSET